MEMSSYIRRYAEQPSHTTPKLGQASEIESITFFVDELGPNVRLRVTTESDPNTNCVAELLLSTFTHSFIQLLLDYFQTTIRPFSKSSSTYQRVSRREASSPY